MNMEFNDIVHAQLLFTTPQGVRKRSLLSRVVGELVRMRFQILFGLFLASAVPAYLLDIRDGQFDTTQYLNVSLFGTSLAFLGGFYIFRKVASFPGVRATSYILPAYVSSYAVFGAVMVLLRKDFSRIQLSISLILTIAFLFAVFFVVRRVRKPVLSVIPAGHVSSLFELDVVDWDVLKSVNDASGRTAIVADLSADLSDDWVRFIADSALHGRPVYNVRQVIESLSGRVQVERLSENSFGTLAPNEIYASAKRYVDIAFACVVLAGSFWLMAIIALVIRLESKGPAIYRQQRMGHRGQPFTIYKFRTMRQATAEEEASNVHLHDTARITPFGQLLRRYRLDELPQLFNILKSEMSWIGPRPEAIVLSQQYEHVLPFYRYRHVVRPGISGWAQVHQGHVVGNESARLKLQYDFFYIKNFSLWLDMLVVLKTFRVVFTGSGAR